MDKTEMDRIFWLAQSESTEVRNAVVVCIETRLQDSAKRLVWAHADEAQYCRRYITTYTLTEVARFKRGRRI